MNADYNVNQPCRYYIVQLTPTGEPITETMDSKPGNRLDVGYTPCNEARVPNYQMVAPVGTKQCFPKSGLRYFYKVDPRTQNIIPPMWSQKGKPNNMCSGSYNILEFKIFK